jgi:hypothetical protein
VNRLDSGGLGIAFPLDQSSTEGSASQNGGGLPEEQHGGGHGITFALDQGGTEGGASHHQGRGTGTGTS